MKIDFKLDEMNSKQRANTFVFPIVIIISTLRYMKKIKNYVKSQNLRMLTFSQFGGKHLRNLFSVTHTSYYLLAYSCFLILDNGMICMLQLYRGQVDKNTQFIIHNMLWVVVQDVFFGLYVPIKHIILSRECLPGLWCDERTVETNKFYVSKQSMSPRRYVKPAVVLTENSERKNKNSFAYLMKSKNKRTPTLTSTNQYYEMDNFFIIIPQTPLSVNVEESGETNHPSGSKEKVILPIITVRQNMEEYDNE